MCDQHKHRAARLPHGSSLADGRAHATDHAWSRRSFLSTMGLATVGGTFMLAGRPVHALANTPLTSMLRRGLSGRILVLVQLEGGNDGLNTVVPVRNDIYYSSRPNVSIAPGETLALDADHGLHPALTGFRDLFDDGKLAIVNNVGYEDSNLSHFRSTDIWMSGSDENVILETGWLGRYLDEVNPDFVNTEPEEPLAVQVGGSGLIFKGPDVDMGMSVRDLNRFDDFLDSGRFYTLDGLPQTTYGTEMQFLRTTVNSAFRYGAAIQAAAARSTTTASYPEGPLGQGLAAIARLINGQLSTNIYVVTLGGFDTHALQIEEHAALLTNLSAGITAFLSDIVDPTVRENIVLATFSEFGRRIEENGSEGTDHGTSAPMFIIGDRVAGGFYGTEADLANPDPNGNMQYDVDYRQVYATLLEDWLGVEAGISAGVLQRPFDTLPFITPSGVATEPDATPAAMTLRSNYPNPFSERTTLGYSLDRPAHVRMELFDVRGQRVRVLADDTRGPGEHEVTLDGFGLASGTYFVRMQSGGGVVTRKVVKE